MTNQEISDTIRRIEREVLFASNISDVPRRARRALDDAREHLRKLAGKVEVSEQIAGGSDGEAA